MKAAKDNFYATTSEVLGHALCACILSGTEFRPNCHNIGISVSVVC